MNVEEAIAQAKKLNDDGKNRHEWYYYPSYLEVRHDWCVMRRPKCFNPIVAVFSDGKHSIMEKQEEG